MAYQIMVFIHILAMLTWVGGALFLVMVVVPYTRRQMQSPSEGARALRQMARRFRTISWVAIVLAVITGLYLAFDHYALSPADVLRAENYFTQVLRIKVILVLVVITLSLLHDFVLGPYVSTRMEGAGRAGSLPDEVKSARTALVWIGRVNLLLILGIVAVSVSMIRGSPV